MKTRNNKFSSILLLILISFFSTFLAGCGLFNKTVNFYVDGVLVNSIEVENKSKISTSYFDYAERQATESTYYVFKGWYLEQAGGTPISYYEVNSDINLYAQFEERTRTYEVVLQAGEGYTLSPYQASTNVVEYGSNFQFTLLVDSAFSNSNYVVMANDEVILSENNIYSITVTGNINIIVGGITKNIYTASFYNEDGTTPILVNELQTQTLEHGSIVTLPAAPTKESSELYNYTFAGWYTAYDGGDVVTNFTITNDLVLYARFTQHDRLYTVTKSTGAGYLIVNEINQSTSVLWGNVFNFSVNLNVGYTDSEISVFANGIEILPTNNQYSITVYQDTLINVVGITKNIYTASFYNEDGTTPILVNGLETQTLEHGSIITIPATPTKERTKLYYYSFSGWYTAYDGGNLVTNFTITNDIDLYARFTQHDRLYTVTKLTGEGYLIVNAIGQSNSVLWGENFRFTVNLDVGYTDSEINVFANGIELFPNEQLYEFTVYESTQIQVSGVQKNTYNLIIQNSLNGTVQMPSATALYGSSVTINLVPDVGYRVEKLVINGVDLGNLTSYNITNINENKNISAIFTIITYQVTISKIGSGSVEASNSVVNYGSSVSFTITPAENYIVSRILVNSIDRVELTSFTLENVNSNLTIQVTFAWFSPTAYNSIGQGTQENPLLIYNATQLISLSNYYNLNNGNFYYYKQMADINLTGIDWVPIGHATQSLLRGFYGNYDGNGYKITNLSIITEHSYLTAGLFGYVHGNIENLIVENANITGVKSYSTGPSTFGVIAGELVGNIKNSFASGVINSTATSLWLYSVGGLLGSIYGEEQDNTGNIENCISDVEIIVTDEVLIRIGGLVGYALGTIRITNSASKGNIELSQNNVYSSNTISIGGMVGSSNEVYINNCYSLSNISVQSTDSTPDVTTYIRIVGISNDAISIENCYYSGIIEYKFLQTMTSVVSNYISYYCEDIQNTVYNYTLASQTPQSGYLKPSITQDLANNNIYKTNAEIISGVAFVGFGEYVDDFNLQSNPYNVWIFTLNELPKLYFEQ